jgi:coenzyme PQQ synthesis protein D (PqqD)
MLSLRLRNDSVAWRAFKEGEGTLVHLDRDEIHSLNATGAVLIKRLKTGATTEELATALCEEFEVDRETAMRDVGAFVERLRESDLVEEVDLAGGGIER